jgi:hypothetical protein
VVNPHGSAATESAIDGGVSAEATLRGGPGSYQVLVLKDGGAGIEGYTITLDCFDAQGNRFAEDQSTLVQNQ